MKRSGSSTLSVRVVLQTVTLAIAALVIANACAAADEKKSEPEASHGRKVIARHGESVRGAIDGVPFVLLRGNASERGEAYGALCGADAAALLGDVLVPVINSKDPEGWDKLTALAGAQFRFPAEIETEMKAFVTGFTKSAKPAERMLKPLRRELRLNDLKLLQAFADLLGSDKLHFGGCSSFSAWGDLTVGGNVITGRNLDYNTFPGKMPLMAIGREPSEVGRMKTVEISLAGVFGASTAMNEEGVLVLLHDEPGLQPQAQSNWIPRIAALREAIETAHATNAVESVANALKHEPLLMGGNVHVSFPLDAAHPERLPAILEWDGNEKDGGVTVRKPSEGASAIYCTNHYLEREARQADGSSRERYEKLRSEANKLREHAGLIGLAGARKMMGAAAVRGPVSTYISIVALPEKRAFQVAFAASPGESATDNRWVELEWADIFGQ